LLVFFPNWGYKNNWLCFPRNLATQRTVSFFFQKQRIVSLWPRASQALAPWLVGLTAWPGPEQAGLVFWPMLLRSKVKPTNHNQNYVICLGVQFFASYIQLCCMFCISLKTSKLVSWCLTQFAFSPLNDGSLGVCL